MPVLQLPPPASHSAAAAAAAASTSAPGPNPETVHGASAAPEAEQELWEMESRARACGKWSSSECAGHLWNLQGPPSLLHFSGTAVARGGDTRYSELRVRFSLGHVAQPVLPTAGLRLAACISCDPTVCWPHQVQEILTPGNATPNCQLSKRML